MERKLVTIQRIKDITPIKDADKIELAHILGWQCVIKKGEFQKNDLCAYCEIDSFLPIRPEFEFLRNTSYRKSTLLGEGFRIKTEKMRGEISQGLVLSMAQLQEMDINTANLKENDDITEQLGVIKWEVPEMATGQGTAIGELGPEVPKTDEIRIQTVTDIIQEFTNLEYYISTKIDGSSHSIAIDKDGKNHVYGHRFEFADDGKSSFAEFVKKHKFFDKLHEYMNKKQWQSVTVQGEWAGEGIQSNRLQLKNPDWFVFTVIANGQRQNLNTMLELCEIIQATHVPIEEIGYNLPEKYPNSDALLQRAEGLYPNGRPKEGIVIRPTEPIFSPTLSDTLSIKAINNKYLLKNKN